MSAFTFASRGARFLSLSSSALPLAKICYIAARQKSERKYIIGPRLHGGTDANGRHLCALRARITSELRSHDAIPRTRVVLGGVPICDPQHLARMLYQSILETASSSGERHIVGASIFDAAQHAGRAHIWAHRGRPECIVLRQEFLRVRRRYSRRRKPFGAQIFPDSRGRVLDHSIDRNMRVVLRN